MRDIRPGEVVEAVAVLTADADPEALRAFWQEHLADFKVPMVIRIVTALPKNAMGKLQRRALAGSP